MEEEHPYSDTAQMDRLNHHIGANQSKVMIDGADSLDWNNMTSLKAQMEKSFIDQEIH